MNKKIKVAILSGGVGSRLWPLSRRSQPKQYLQIFEGKSLFDLAVERNFPLADHFIIIGNRDNKALSLQSLKNSNVDFSEITEAVPRNTAAAIAFAVLACEPEDVILVTPSDHIITDTEAYAKSVEKAAELAQEGFLVTFGIKPTKPETGFGYIEYNGEDVLSFREKPNFDTAKSFLNSGNFLWNSGMFCFKAQVLLEELKKYEPAIFAAAEKCWNERTSDELDREKMMKIPSKSIDYAVMERSDRIKVVAGDFGWSDLGSFESLYDYLKSTGTAVDDFGNMYIGSEKVPFFLGLENTIVVSTDEAILTLKKERAQEVKNIYETLEKQNSDLIQ